MSALRMVFVNNITIGGEELGNFANANHGFVVADGSALELNGEPFHAVADVLVDGQSHGALIRYEFISPVTDHTLKTVFEPASPGTCIPGGDVSGTWGAGGSPYQVQGDINIPLGETLTIDPGVEVVFYGHYAFGVQGQLLAEGAADHRILFTALDPDVGWHGLRFDGSEPGLRAESRLAYCVIEGGKALGPNPADSQGGGIYCVDGADVTLSDSVIRENTSRMKGGGIYASEATLRLERVAVEGNDALSAQGGGICALNCDPMMTDVTIAGNTASGTQTQS